MYSSFEELKRDALALSLDGRTDSMGWSLAHILSQPVPEPGNKYALATIRAAQAQAYLEHLTQRIPYALSVLADPRRWRAARLVDEATGVLRRPRICLQAHVNGKQSLLLYWSLVPSEGQQLEGYDSFQEWLAASDFLSTASTWPFAGHTPEYTLVKLTRGQYPEPLEPHPCVPDLEREETSQRFLFNNFLACVVQQLSGPLEVQIGDWVSFDEDNRLVMLPLRTRVLKSAKKQLDLCRNDLTNARRVLDEVLAFHGLDQATLEGARQRHLNEGLILASVLKETGKKKLSNTSSTALLSKLSRLEAAQADVAQCEAIFAQAKEAF